MRFCLALCLIALWTTVPTWASPPRPIEVAIKHELAGINFKAAVAMDPQRTAQFKDMNKETYAHLLVRLNRPQQLWLLIEALSDMRENVQKFLHRRCSLCVSAQELSVQLGHLECFQVLACRLGSRLRVPNRFRWTLLHLAAFHNQPKIISDLLLHKAPIDRNDNDGWTALDVALFQRSDAAARLLLAHGASSHVQVPTPLETTTPSLPALRQSLHRNLPLTPLVPYTPIMATLGGLLFFLTLLGMGIS